MGSPKKAVPRVMHGYLMSHRSQFAYYSLPYSGLKSDLIDRGEYSGSRESLLDVHPMIDDIDYNL